MKTACAALMFGVALLAVSGCGESQKPAAPVDAPKAAASAALPPGLFLKEAPAGAKDVGAAKANVKEGDEIVIRGQIGGSPKDVFNPGRASFSIADMKLPACSMKPDEKCDTPWDFCCETPETRSANTAMIQITDADGKILKSDVHGVSGIEYLSVVVVKGKVAKREGPNLVVNATGVFVEKTVPLPH